MLIMNLSERHLAIAAVAILAYLVILIFAYLRQEKLIYFPNRYTHAEAVGRAGRLGLHLWPADSADYQGLVSRDFPGRSKGVVLIFHGNAGAAADRFYYVSVLQGLGYRVVLFEYPGYGARTGSLREASFVSDALRAARAAVDEFGGPLYVWGESLGCAVASALAGSSEVTVKGIVMVTPWDTLPDLAQNLYWYAPARWLIRDRYDNIVNLRDFKGPIAVVMADKDEIIPGRRTKRLFEALPAGKRLWVLRNAGHNDWLAAVDETWWKEIMEFVSGGMHGD